MQIATLNLKLIISIKDQYSSKFRRSSMFHLSIEDRQNKAILSIGHCSHPAKYPFNFHMDFRSLYNLHRHPCKFQAVTPIKIDHLNKRNTKELNSWNCNYSCHNYWDKQYTLHLGPCKSHSCIHRMWRCLNINNSSMGYRNIVGCVEIFMEGNYNRLED